VLPLVHKTGLIALIVVLIAIAAVWIVMWQRRQRAPRSI
jgi:hypothetical protein